MKRRRKRSTRKRGIYLLPNLITTGSLFFGFLSIISSVQGRFQEAALAILVSMFLDGLDGRVARITKTTSRFGVEYDSLCDLIAFGIAPALMVFLWALEPMGRIGWLASFLFMACGALRLARFNVQVNSIGNAYFNGLPIPAAACMIATTVLFFEHLDLSPHRFQVAVMASIYMLSFLMVSTIPFISFKQLHTFRERSLNTLVAGVLLFVVMAAKPYIMMFVVILFYVTYGVVSYIGKLIRRKPVEEASDEGEREPASSEAGG